MSSAYKPVAFLTMAWLLAACTHIIEHSADEGLVAVEPGNFDHILMLPGDPLQPQITRVSIADPVVIMSEYWLREHRGDYFESDLERIKEDYSEFLRETLAETLTEDTDVEVVQSDSAADVVLRPYLRDLNIYAPDIGAPITDSYITSAGNATLDLRFFSPQLEEVVAQFIDHRETDPIVHGELEETNRAVNNRLFINLMEHWSHNLVEYLDEEDVITRE